MRPRDPRLFLTKEELARPVTFSSADGGRIDYESSELRGLYAGEGQGSAQGELSSHATNVLAMACGIGDRALCPSGGVRHYYHRGLENLQKNRSRLDLSHAPVGEVNISAGAERETLGMRTTYEQLARENHINVTWAAGNNDGQCEFAKAYHYSNQHKVGALEQNGRVFAAYSGPAEPNGFVAPFGQGTNTLGRGNDMGTSYAAPQVAGVLLAIQKVNSTLSASSRKAILRATSTPIGQNPYLYGYGLPNVVLASALAREIDSGKFNRLSAEEAVKEAKTLLEKSAKKRTQNKISGRRVLAGTTCKEFSEGLDALFNEWFLSGRSEAVGSQLCKVFSELKFEWGEESFCSLDYLLKTKGEGWFFGTGIRMSLLLQGLVSSIPDRDRRERLAERAFAIAPRRVAMDLLSSEEFAEQHPELWKKQVETLLKEPNGIDLVAKYLLPVGWIQRRTEMENWLERVRPDRIQCLLHDQAFLRAHKNGIEKMVNARASETTSPELVWFAMSANPDLRAALPDLAAEWQKKIPKNNLRTEDLGPLLLDLETTAEGQKQIPVWVEKADDSVEALTWLNELRHVPNFEKYIERAMEKEPGLQPWITEKLLERADFKKMAPNLWGRLKGKFDASRSPRDRVEAMMAEGRPFSEVSLFVRSLKPPHDEELLLIPEIVADNDLFKVLSSEIPEDHYKTADFILKNPWVRRQQRATWNRVFEKSLKEKKWNDLFYTGSRPGPLVDPGFFRDEPTVWKKAVEEAVKLSSPETVEFWFYLFQQDWLLEDPSQWNLLRLSLEKKSIPITKLLVKNSTGLPYIPESEIESKLEELFKDEGGLEALSEGPLQARTFLRNYPALWAKWTRKIAETRPGLLLGEKGLLRSRPYNSDEENLERLDWLMERIPEFPEIKNLAVERNKAKDN